MKNTKYSKELNEINHSKHLSESINIIVCLSLIVISFVGIVLAFILSDKLNVSVFNIIVATVVFTVFMMQIFSGYGEISEKTEKRYKQKIYDLRQRYKEHSNKIFA